MAIAYGITKYQPGLDHSANFLSKAGEDDSALLLILVTKLLAVAILLLPSPAPHLQPTHSNEDQHTPVQLADKENTQPSQNLKEVVGTGNDTEAEPRRNASLSGTGPAEITQDVVRIQIRQLTEDKQRQSGVHKSLIGGTAGGGRVRTEHPVGDVETGQNPVVGAILDDVAGGHGGTAETVHEDCLELALQEVHA